MSRPKAEFIEFIESIEFVEFVESVGFVEFVELIGFQWRCVGDQWRYDRDC